MTDQTEKPTEQATEQPTEQTETLESRTVKRLGENLKLLTEIGGLKAQRAGVVMKVERAGMLEKAKYVTEAVAVSLEIEDKLTQIVTNLCALAADETGLSAASRKEGITHEQTH